MKFNLKTYAEKVKEGDIHHEKKLQRDHVKAPESITEDQLGEYHVDEKDVLTEKLLEKTRTGSADRIIEKNLSESTSKLHKHRNAEAYTGDLNKVEEQRLSRKKQEDEKAEAASSTPKKKRWWEHLKAESRNRVVTARELDFSEEERWGRLQTDDWNEEGVSEDGPVAMDDMEETAIEKPEGNFLTLNEIRPVDTPIAKGLYVSFDITPEGTGIDINRLQENAYQATIDAGYSYLAGVEGFSPESFVSQGDRLVARLIGDEFNPEGKDSEEGLGENPFVVSDLQNTEVEGVVLGSINIDPEMSEMVATMDDEILKRQILDSIGESHPEVSVEEDGIDLDKISEGKINFVGQVEVQKKSRPESWENVKGAPIASNDFDIVVLSSTKKN